MRVGLLIYGTIETVSGGYIYDRKLVEVLESAGDSVEIISLPWRSYPLHLADNLSNSLLNRLTMLNVDVLVQDELNHPSLFLLNEKLRSRVRYPLVSLVHHLRTSEKHARLMMPLYRRVEVRYLRSVDGYIFNSNTTRAVVEGFVGTDKPSVVATPAGDRMGKVIEPAEIRERAQAEGPLRLLFLGSVISRKGLHVVLDALNKLDSMDWTLTVAGSLEAEPGYARRMIGRAERCGWSHRVNFTGPLVEEDLRRILRESHLLVMPSSYEGFGIVYLEAMGAGLPAIGTTHGAAREVIRHGETGYLVEPGDSDGLARTLLQLNQDRERLAKMGKAGLEGFTAFPGWAESMLKIRHFLSGLAG